jgi:hypothetical protein
MHRAVKMYEMGGPGKWICSQFVAWTLAIPGGLDMNSLESKPKGCDLPKFVVNDLQPFPGGLMSTPYWSKDSAHWYMPCDGVGCFVGVPNVPKWAGGTTALPTTTTTTTTVTTTTVTTTTPTPTTTKVTTTPTPDEKESDDKKSGDKKSDEKESEQKAAQDSGDVVVKISDEEANSEQKKHTEAGGHDKASSDSSSHQEPKAVVTKE